MSILGQKQLPLLFLQLLPVTAVVGFEMIEVDSIRLSLDAAKPPITSLFSYSASAVTATTAASAAVSDLKWS